MPDAGDPILAEDFSGFGVNTSSTDETGISSTTYTAGSTPVGASFVTPTSERVVVMWQCRWESDSTNHTLISFALRTGSVIGSGTVIQAASDAFAIEGAPGAGVNDGRAAFRVLTGLGAGVTFNVQMEFRVTANTSDIFDRQIVVIPIP